MLYYSSLWVLAAAWPVCLALDHAKLFKPTPMGGMGVMSVHPSQATTLILTYQDAADVNGLKAKIASLNNQTGIPIKDGGVQKVYNSLKMMKMEYATEAAALAVLDDPSIKSAEYVQNYKVNTLSWGWDRVTQRQGPPDRVFKGFPGDGEGVDAYIVDTGVSPTHPDLAGRVTLGFVSDGSGRNADDENGHGSHVAGTVGGMAYGIAKKANLIAVKVLNSLGDGTTDTVLQGLEWVAQKIAEKPNGKHVINLSLGGSSSEALRQAVSNLAGANAVVVCAAGNEGQNACSSSPGNSPGSYTVGATSSSDIPASFTNYGGCVDILAPGVNIPSVDISDGGFVSWSGTSMAAPHVAGAVAVYWALNPGLSGAAVRTAMTNLATPNAVGGDLKGSPNRLLYVGPEYIDENEVSSSTPTPTETPEKTETQTRTAGLGEPTTVTTTITTTTTYMMPTTLTTTAVTTKTVTIPPYDQCQGTQCRNGGQCLTLNTGRAYCQCPVGFGGRQCQFSTNPCRSAPCRNGGMCLALLNGRFSCQCRQGFIGSTCAIALRQTRNQCQPNPCKNRGVCHEKKSGGFFCQCPTGWTGTWCHVGQRCVRRTRRLIE